MTPITFIMEPTPENMKTPTLEEKVNDDEDG